MPTPLMKSLAKQSGKKTKTIESLWKKCEKLVKKEYEIDEKSSRFYPLVVGCLKNLLDIKTVKEDADITTSTMGDYKYYPKIGATMSRPIISEPSSSKIINKKKDLKKTLDGFSYEIKKRNKGEKLDEILSSMIEFYSSKFDNSEEIVEVAIEMTGKYLGINIVELESD
jgi:ABC-type Fe3+-hydroxamate transport system substrate-binding protein